MLDKLFNLDLTTLSLALDLFYMSDGRDGSDASTHASIRCIGDAARYTDTSGLLLSEGSEVDALYLALDLVLDLCGYMSLPLARWMGGQRTRLLDILAVVVRKRFI